jgi:RHH-type proline utilization regulon transcriptional repressor/proline dehydrogenase/delta 1-pyrroline-5-carboxylate dehydrogenase
VARKLAERLAGAVEALAVGQAETFGVDVPPVIEPVAAERVRRYAEEGARAGRIAARAPAAEDGPCAVDAVLLTDLPAASPLLADEIFGPVLTLEAVPSVEEACAVVEELPFALTGGLFSRDPATVKAVAARLPVGNLYVNRRLTGAVVARQPFGGNRLSGVGSKAGGPDYLLQFVEPRVVSENTMRHGLVT